MSSSEVILASAGLDNTICTWSLPSITRHRSFACTKGPIGCLDLSLDAKYLSVGACLQLHIFDRNASPGNVTPAFVLHEGGHVSAVSCIGHFNTPRLMLYTAGDDCGVRIWDAGARQASMQTTLPTSIHHGIPLSPQRSLSSMLFAGDDGALYHWSIETNSVSKAFAFPSTTAIPSDLPPRNPPSCTKLAICHETNIIAVGLADGNVALFKLPYSGSLPDEWLGPHILTTSSSFVTSLNISSFPTEQGSILLTVAGINGQVSFYKVVPTSLDSESCDLFSFSQLRMFNSQTLDPVLDSTLTNDGEHLFAASLDGRVYWYRVLNEEGDVKPYLFYDRIRHSDSDSKGICSLSMRDVVRKW
ncbi:hypothetical protein P9112_012128 [Eukaryota sp. TZLM1-RC]